MKNPAPIIAGIDFSASSVSVLHQALHHSASTSNPVIALHVLDSSRLAHHAANTTGELDPEILEHEAMTRLSEWVSAHASDAKLRLEVRRGRPSEELRRAAEEHQASLLVIAANDTTKNRLGAIASRCVRTAPCDVMILRNWQTGNFRKVLICTDFSSTSSRALVRAVDIASEQGATLEIVHVMYPPARDVWGEVLEHDPESTLSYKEECHVKIERSMERFTSPLRERLDGLDHQYRILESVVPSVALSNHASDSGADLVVMGTRGHSKLMSHFVGTNAERLMHDSPVSVLAVRSPDEVS